MANVIRTTTNIKANAGAVWAALRGLDFTFVSPRVQSMLVQDGEASTASSKASSEPESKDRKELDRLNTSKSYVTEWVKPGTVRTISVSSCLDTTKEIDTGLVAGVPPLFFDQKLKLTGFSEEKQYVDFEVISPSTLTLSEDMLTALGGSISAADSVVHVPKVHSITVTTESPSLATGLSATPDSSSETKKDADASAVATGSATPLVQTNVQVAWQADFGSETNANDVSKTFIKAYQEFVLAALAAAVTGPYPHTPRRAVTDNYHGVAVTDPFRWLEDPDSEETKRWVDAQNAVTEGVLAACDTREKILNRLMEMYQYERFSRPSRAGKYYYYFKNNGLQNQSVLWQTATLDDAGRVFLDPHTIDAEGTAALGSYSLSRDGKYFAYGVCRNGSDWNTIYVRDTETLKDSPEELHWVRFSSIAWTHDQLGFFYSRYPAPKSLENADVGKRGTETDTAGNQALYYHRVGTSQEQDVKVFSCEENPKWMMSAVVTDCGGYIVISISDSCDPVNLFYYASLKDFSAAVAGMGEKDTAETYPKLDIVKLYDKFEAEYSYLTNVGTVFYLKTNLKAPRYRVITVDIASPADSVKELIPEPEGSGVLSSVGGVAGHLVAVYNIDVCDYLKVFTLKGEERKDVTFNNLPPYSSIGISGEIDQRELFLQVTSMLYSGVSYVYNFDTAKLTLFKESKPKGFDSSAFEVKQVFYPSKDGTKIPMFITHKKDIKLDGSNPTYLYGYGGFNITLGPSFSVNRWMFMQHFGGVVAVANLRGGGEYGETWHKVGSLLQKQNVFDDFQYAARYLVENKFTSHDKVAIHGGSNGGLLVAACVNQQPQLFGAAVAAVGVLDMLRFHRFTIGYAWCSDYGNAETTEADFKYLHAYSPLHTVGSSYPPLMLTTADHDDRVVPLHSLKYIAQVQRIVGRADRQRPSRNPVVIRVETKAGHGAGKPLKKQMAEHADVFGFFAKHIGAVWTD